MKNYGFCFECKKVIGEAKYCKECGSKLTPIGEQFLSKEQVSLENIANFLKNVLGYAKVNVYDSGCIDACFHPMEKAPRYLEIQILDRHVWIFTDYEISKNVSNDLNFFKFLNRINEASLVRCTYIEPDKESYDEDDLIGLNKYSEKIECTHGNLRVSLFIPFDKQLSLFDFFMLAKGNFEVTNKYKLAQLGLAEYLGIISLI